MKKNLMFFVLGVSTTLLMGAGISYWNEIRQENKYGVLVDRLGYGNDIPYDNKYGVLVDRLGYGNDIPYDNKYGVLVDRLGGGNAIPDANKYALVLDGEIGDDAKKAMVVGFINGMAIGRKKAKEEIKKRLEKLEW